MSVPFFVELRLVQLYLPGLAEYVVHVVLLMLVKVHNRYYGNQYTTTCFAHCLCPRGSDFEEQYGKS